ncbi:MAG: DUF2799 domain-containing protein [Oceanospirillaceae bacterium]|nr:DUF2799 domain-containing protein [Oceanospirillaceae bacterium]
MNYLHATAMASLAIFISGCASLSQSECISANWYDLGAQNAMSGKESSYVAEHTKACGEYAINPDFTLYKLGWLNGQSQFCTAASGWRFAAKGGHYKNTCSLYNERDFLAGFRLGKTKREKQAEVNNIKAELKTLVKYSLKEGLTPQQLADIAFERLDLKMDLRFLDMEINRLEDKAQRNGYFY